MPFQPFRQFNGKTFHQYGSGAKRPNAIMLNGSGFINCGSDAGLDGLQSAAFTAEAWVYPVTFAGNYKSIISKLSATTVYGWDLKFYSSAILQTLVKTNTISAETVSLATFLNAWHHIVVCYDNAGDRKCYLYMDGILLAAETAATGTVRSEASYNLVIGDDHSGNQKVPSGTIFGWSRVSNAVRYTVNFVPDSRLAPPAVDANTVGQWNMTEGTGTTVDNAEGTAARDGIITGGTWVYCP